MNTGASSELADIIKNKKQGINRSDGRFFRSLLHGAFSCHFTANIPFHKMRLLVPKLLKSKFPAMLQKMFARASHLLYDLMLTLHDFAPYHV